MKMIFKRTLSLLLAVAMMMSFGIPSVAAISPEEAGTVQLSTNTVETTKSSEDQTVFIYLYMDKDAEIFEFETTVAIEDVSSIGAKFGSGAEFAVSDFDSIEANIVAGKTSGKFSVYDEEQSYAMPYDNNLPGYLLAKVPVLIPANTTGEVKVKFTGTFFKYYGVDDNGEEVYESFDLKSDSVTATITVSEPVDSSNPKFTVYYEIANSTKNEDNDTFMEFDPGAEVWVDVYVKADQTVTMQAFDIYPLWADKLTYTGIEAADNIQLETSEMTAANPHFLTEFVDDGSNTNVAIDTNGTKLATLKFTLNNDAVYGTHYPVYFGEDTNLARAKNAESATVTYETVAATATVGAETLKTYTVTYDANTTENVTGMPDPATAQKQHNVKLDLPQLTRASYNFLGWATTSNASEAEYTNELLANENPADGLVLYAVWKANTHTVTWKNFDGTTEFTTTEVTHGEKPSDPGTPSYTKVGYTTTFQGWATSANQTSGVTYDKLDAVTADDVVYYAAFSAVANNYTIDFNANEGIGSKDVIPATYDQEVTLTANTTITRTGYTFNGWNTKKDGTGDAYVDGAKVKNLTSTANETVTLFAQWTINTYDVTYSDNGTTTTKEDVTYNTEIELQAAAGKSGYTFKGWHDGEKIVGGAGDKYTVTDDVTLTAKYDPNTYTVKFYPGAGDGEMEDQTFIYDADAQKLTANAFTAPSKDHVFAGWDTDGAATTVVYTNEQALRNVTTEANAVIELYAVWQQDVFAITYTHPDGVNVTTELPGTFSASEDKEIPNPEAAGYTFTGWTSTALNITTATKDVTITAGRVNTVVDLTSNWAVNSYTITFNNEDGSKYHTITQDYGSEVAAPAAPEKEGYTFAGWVDADNNVVTFPTTMPAENMTLTATWNINQYTITFVDTDDTTIADIKQDYGTAVTAPANPTKTGYTFKSWDKKIPTTMPAEDMTITAQWTINQYTITFNTDGGSAIEAIEQDYNTAVTAPTNPTKTGYNFVKWVDENGNEVTVPTTMPAENITLKAIWEAVTYNVTLNANGGKLDETVTNPFEVIFNSAYGTLAEPARGGYKFDGWFYTNAENEETQIIADSVVSVAGDHELVAKWTANEYTVTFDPANGGEVSTLQFKTDIGFTTPAAPEYAYHTFKGWKVTSTNGNWPVDHVYNAGTAVKDNYGDVTLTAQWEGSLKHVVEGYKYAPANYVMLRIETTAENTSAYKFGDIEMYYTADTDYRLNGNPVLVTLIPKKDGETDLIKKATSGDGYELTDAGLDKLSETDTGAIEIVRDGKINMNDDIVNIADANAVYQMIVNESTGGYYSIDQLEIYNRLVADMSTEIGEKADHRGSIADVNAIVTIINNAANAN